MSSARQQLKTDESFGDYVNAILSLLKSDRHRKLVIILVAVLIFALVTCGSFMMMWCSGSGWISNRTIKHNVNGITMPGINFGSQTLYARKGQSIQVDVDMHECKEGGLTALIIPERWRVPYNEYTRLNIEDAGKRTMIRKVEKTGSYRIEFHRMGEKTKNLVRTAFGSTTDLCYSANWEVK